MEALLVYVTNTGNHSFPYKDFRLRSKSSEGKKGNSLHLQIKQKMFSFSYEEERLEQGSTTKLWRTIAP